MTHALPWYGDICNYLVTSTYPTEASQAVKDKLASDAKYYVCDNPCLRRLCNNQVTHRCISESKIKLVLHFCHSTLGGGHYRSVLVEQKVLFEMHINSSRPTSTVRKPEWP
ncbi:hypothetical protein CR513_18829, partial [Mucuna pruriens]